jgi:hypothetical protein
LAGLAASQSSVSNRFARQREPIAFVDRPVAIALAII